jgi:hypothetical protein
MDKIKALIREPALLVDAFESAVVFFIAMGLFSLSGDQQTNTVAVFIALLALLKGFLTQPFPVTVITDLGRAAVVWSVSLGLLSWTPDQVTITVTFLGTLMTLIQRAQITPRYDTVAAPTGAGSGPVTSVSRGEQGATNFLFVAGVVLVVLGLLALLLIVTGDAFVKLPIAIIVLVIGGILVFASRRSV